MNITRHKPSQLYSPREVLPVLIPCEKGRPCDGVANFYRISQAPAPKVRLLRNADIERDAIDQVLSRRDRELLEVTMALKQARERNESLFPEALCKKLMVQLGWPKGTDARIAWPNVHVPRLASDAMKDARLVLWQKSGKFLPAIYCPSLRAAVFVRAFMSLQRCPHCGLIFVPHKNNVVYCCAKHGHSHRVARMRAKKPRSKQRGRTK
jgi:uncharacterized C2H2 Zn-finger protein